MDFFEHQDQARRKSNLLVLLFIMAVVSLVMLTYFLQVIVFGVLEFIAYFVAENLSSEVSLFLHILDLFYRIAEELSRYDKTDFLFGTGIVTAIILLVSLHRIVSLSKYGGAQFAKMLDGRLVTGEQSDLKLQRLLNLAEEMAVASGIPVPSVYLLDERGINAFSLGHSLDNVVIAVTQGAIDHLDRDELQGVIAHEFSHILNGDIKINIKLMGILRGILLLQISMDRFSELGILERYTGNILDLKLIDYAVPAFFGVLFYVTEHVSFLFLFCIYIIGHAGYFLGGLIKVAISRQREHLADAFAVQFTRNPKGIAGALKRIGGYELAGYLANPNAKEIGHALFVSTQIIITSPILETHPSLENRIRRIEPNWNGEFRYRSKRKIYSNNKAKRFVWEQPSTLEEPANKMRWLTPENYVKARSLIERLPSNLKRAAHEPFSAAAVVYYLLLSEHHSVRDLQLSLLQQSADPTVYYELLRLSANTRHLTVEGRLPLLEMTIPTLRQLSDLQLAAFKGNISMLIAADKRINIFEWSLKKIVLSALDKSSSINLRLTMFGNISRLMEPCSLIISILIYCDDKPKEIHAQLVRLAEKKLGCEGLRLYKKSELDLNKLDAAIEKLKRLKPLLKPKLLKAFAAVITSDSRITPSEAELIRAISDTLDCPMPLIQDGVNGWS